MTWQETSRRNTKKTLNSTYNLNPKPTASNSKPSTLNPQTPNPQTTPGPKPEIAKPYSCVRDPQPDAHTLYPQTTNNTPKDHHQISMVRSGVHKGSIAGSFKGILFLYRELERVPVKGSKAGSFTGIYKVFLGYRVLGLLSCRV